MKIPPELIMQPMHKMNSYAVSYIKIVSCTLRLNTSTNKTIGVKDSQLANIKSKSPRNGLKKKKKKEGKIRKYWVFLSIKVMKISLLLSLTREIYGSALGSSIMILELKGLKFRGA